MKAMPPSDEILRVSSRSERGSRSRFKRRGSLLAGSGCTLLNPTDAKHQKSSAFSPNKLELWDNFRPGHVQENMFTLGDEVHLNEVSCMKMSLMAVQERGAIPKWVCTSIRSWWEHHYEWVLSRAECFRDYWIPLAEARFHYPHILKDDLLTYIHQLHKISKTVLSLRPDDYVDDLLNEWISYEESVLSYKTHNGNMGIMLYHAYFSPEEDAKHAVNAYRNYYTSSGAILEKFMTQKSPGFISAIVHVVGEDVFRSEIMPRENFPDSLWDAAINNQYKEYTNTIVPHGDALLTGNAPAVCTNIGEEDKFQFGLEQFLGLAPFDPEYQRDERFPPAKLWEWKETLIDQINNSPRAMAFKAQYAEANRIKEVLLTMKSRGRPLMEWEVASIQKFFSVHYDCVSIRFDYDLQDHFPFVEERVNLPVVFKESSVAFMKVLRSLHMMVDYLKVGDRVDHLLDAWTLYESKFAFAHSQEPKYIILFHTYFSREEHSAFLTSKVRNGSAVENIVGNVIYYLGKERFRKFLMVQESFGDLNWHLKFGPKYIDYVENAVSHIEALEQGSPRKTKNGKAARMLSFLQSNLSDEVDQKSVLSQFSKSFKKLEETTAEEGDCLPEGRAKDDENDTLSNLIDSLYSEFRKPALC